MESAFDRWFWSLDSYAALYVVAAVPGVGVHVVGGATAELIALANLSANDHAYGEDRDACGDEADVAKDKARFALGA